MSNRQYGKNSSINDEETTQILNLIRLLFEVIYSNGFRFFLSGIFGGIIGLIFSMSYNPVFIAKSRFIVKESGPSALASSLGSLGSLLGGAGSSSLDKTVAVIGSEKIVGKVLLTLSTIGDTNDLVINHFIRLSNLSEKWSKDTVLGKANFTARDTILEALSFPQRKVFKAVLSSFLGEDGIVDKSFDKKSGIVSLEITHGDEEFAIEVNKLIYKELRSFFQEQASESANLNVEILTKKVDSIQSELNSIRIKLARRTDQSMGIFLNEDKVDVKALAVKEQILLTMYSEAQKNLETFLFMEQSASNSTALNLLEFPYSPLTPTKKSKILFSLSGFFLASFFSFSFILTRIWFKKYIAS